MSSSLLDETTKTTFSPNLNPRIDAGELQGTRRSLWEQEFREPGIADMIEILEHPTT